MLENTVQENLDLFIRVNIDCSQTGGTVVPFADIGYYTDQIFNLNNEENWDECYKRAQQIWALSANLNIPQ
jgi:hypothetical protein